MIGADVAVAAQPFVPDLPRAAAPAGVDNAGFADALAGALDAASGALQRADAAEKVFARGRGGVAEMVVERAQADVLLSIAASAASRATQSLSTLLNMQV